MSSRGSAKICSAIATVLLIPLKVAEGQTAERPEYKLIRFEEDWSSLRDLSRRTDWFDPVKYIPFGQQSYLTIGGETRQRYEYFRNGTWGLDHQDDNGYLLQRYMLHADLHLGERFRFFGQLKSNIETGRTGGPRPADEDRLDVHQAFVEVQLPNATESTFHLRAGRQEISLGSSRLVGIREGPNVRQSYDGGRLAIEHRRWRVDLLAVRPVETNLGIFDDSIGHRQTFWGVYATGKSRRLWGKTDLYYLGLDRKSHKFDQGTAREQRHSLGIRASDKHGPWDYDYEGVWQFGDFGTSRIRAWTVASNTGYTIEGAPFRPRLGLKADIASGDKDPLDHTLGTFNALYPKGAYFSEADLLGPYNIMDLHPSVTFFVTRTVSITPDADFFWRQSTRDGIYDMPGNLIVSGKDARARYVGAHASIAVEWEATRHLRITANYLHFFPGPFLREVGLDRPVNFVGLWATYKF